MTNKKTQEQGLICPVRRPISPVSRLNIATKRLTCPVCRIEEKTGHKVGTSSPAKTTCSSLQMVNSVPAQSATLSESSHIHSFTRPEPNIIKFSLGSCNYTFAERGSTFFLQSGEEFLIFDGILKIEKKIRTLEEIFDQHGNAKNFSSSVHFEVAIHSDDFIFSGVVSLSDIEKGDFLRRLTDGEVTLQPDSAAKKLFKILVAHKIRAKEYPIETIFATPGWKKLKGHGWLYATPQGIIGRPELPMRSKNNKIWGVLGMPSAGSSIATDFLSMRSVLPGNQPAYILFQYFFIMALMKGLLRDYGFNPQFLLAIIGETNTRKTSLSNFAFKLYDRNFGVDIDFTATKIALLEAMGENADAVTIFDDLTPPDSSSSAHDLKSKLELLTRGFGGNTPRKRSKSYVDANPGATEFTPILSSGVITGEVFPVTLKSSRSRIVKVELKPNDCNLTELTWHQQRLDILPNFAWDFISFLTDNIQNAMFNVNAIFNSVRRQNELKLKTPRYVEVFALFSVVANIFSLYLSSRSKLSSDEIASLVNADLNAIAYILQCNDIEINSRPDEVIIAEAVLDCLANQTSEKQHIEPLKKIYDIGDYLVIYPQYLMSICRDKCVLQDKIFQFLNTTELSKFLDSKGLVKVGLDNKNEQMNKKNKRRITLKFSFDGNSSQRFYYLKKQELQKLVESASD